jgi:uncharacterized circularly permuted ATP-grasp superfamily protein/uncharacterized alpha-E superfamily protein
MLQNLFAHYPEASDRYDELRDRDGRPRQHWARLHEELGGLAASVLQSRLESVARDIRDSGVTYNVYADPQGLDRPWQLDCLPLILPADEWAEIEAGMAQRAKLLNLILADLYGAQKLLHDGHLPPAIVLGHSGFLRPARGMQVPAGVYLHHYAADLARSPDGRWWVLSDRTQAPSGSGYALENRLVVGRAFPELFQSLQVRRLASYFLALRDALLHYAPEGDGPAQVVVLTPGPWNETYFEHAFLSRYLGFPLVEGGDLVVRRDRLWMKTLQGLRRVHAIVRRQDDTYCDPLELRADSALGVPGLLDCARRGTVLMANALGAGVIESGSLLGFLPRLCEHLLGETLKLPSVATWWCGEPAARDDAVAKMDRLVFKPADPARGFEPIFGQDLDAAGKRRLVARLKAAPQDFIAQETVRISQAPSFTAGPRLGGRGIGLRSFAVATPRGYLVMPGGLTRVAAQADPKVISSQRGGGTKDTWVLAKDAINPAPTLLSERRPRGGAIITSRVVENLFWFGRYAERCDDTARLLRTGINSLVQDAGEITQALAVLADREGLEALPARGTAPWCRAATLETDPAGLPAQLAHLARVAFGLRERMSLDNWRAINRLMQDAALGRQLPVADSVEWVERVIVAMMTIAGFAIDGMTRDLGWRFMSIGRRLERLAFVTSAVDVALDESSPENLGWLLELCDSGVTFRARYMTRTDWPSVLELVVFDDANPRAASFLLGGLIDYLMHLEREIGYRGVARHRALLETLRALEAESVGPEHKGFRTNLRAIHDAALELNDELSAQYFSHLSEVGVPTLAP